MAWKRRVGGGFVAFVGYMLSPLSWWNDAFVNFPLALAFAWLVSLPFGPGRREAWFTVSCVAGYWLTNIIGLIMLHKGAKQAISGEKVPYTRRALLRDIGVSLAYTALIIVLIEIGVLKPIAGYFHS